jgi:hypothetical protein
MTHALNDSRKRKFFWYFKRMKIIDRKKHGTYMKSRNSMKRLIVYNMWFETNNLMLMIALGIHKFCKFKTIINNLTSNTVHMH